MRRLFPLVLFCLAAIGPATAQDAGGGSAPVTAPSPEEAPAAVQAIDGPTFVQKVMMGNHLEVSVSRVAADRAAGAAVRDFARRLVADHEAAADRLGGIVTTKGIGADATGAVETTDPATAEALGRLEKATGDGFDRLYLEIVAKAHEDAIRLFTAYAETGDNAALRDFAVSTLPTLQEHQHDAAELSK
jgi:putative membrane protein